jgi:hypothetical protein
MAPRCSAARERRVMLVCAMRLDGRLGIIDDRTWSQNASFVCPSSIYPKISPTRALRKPSLHISSPQQTPESPLFSSPPGGPPKSQSFSYGGSWRWWSHRSIKTFPPMTSDASRMCQSVPPPLRRTRFSQCNGKLSASVQATRNDQSLCVPSSDLGWQAF